MPEPPRILIADDEPMFLKTTAALLEKAGFECRCAPHGHAALEALERESFQLIISDLKMPGNLQLELLTRSRADWPDTPLIVVTGAPSLPTAIESLRLGIADYLLKPVKYDDLLASVRRALAHQATVRAAPADDGPAQRPPREARGWIADSEPMRRLEDLIERCARHDSSVLITGESGTGKEVAAEMIHRLSRRKHRPFQIVDCTAIPDTLFESTLFGHARGAFTGAIRNEPGLLVQADGGTVFLDELGELPLNQQAKLLRLIQSQSFTPVGMSTPRQVDVRFLAATNRDLQAEVQAGRFRSDLFFRLAVIHLEMPRLAERGDDILRLAQHFLDTLRGDGSPVAGFSPEVIELFRRHPWPGNVRELRNAVEHGHALCRGVQITLDDLPAAFRGAATAATLSAASTTRAAARDDAEKRYLISLLEQHRGNVAGCARVAEVSRQYFHGLLRKYQIDPAAFR